MFVQDKRDDDISFEEQLEALDHVVKQGKVCTLPQPAAMSFLECR